MRKKASFILSRACGSFSCLGLALALALASAAAAAQSSQGYGFASPGGFGLKIYRVDYALYPFLHVYMRTFDDRMQPLVNLNERNVLVMIQGKPYDPRKMQYGVQSIRQRQEATRTVVVIDASKSMGRKTKNVKAESGRFGGDTPFDESLRATIRFIESKRPQDEVAVLAIRDTKEGYEVVSNFERDERALARRIADIRPDGLKTRLYDAVGAAMQMCGTSAQGSVVSGDYIVSCSLLVMSDGKDEGSSLSRDDLMTRISNLPVPFPIYSLAYSRLSRDYFKNLEALSKNSFGIYYVVGETTSRMQQIVEEVQNILQSDYVITLRSYLPVDGQKHNIKIGVEYPTGSGKYVYDDTDFEAIQQPPIGKIKEAKMLMEKKIPALPDGNPYWEDDSSSAMPQAPGAGG